MSEILKISGKTIKMPAHANQKWTFHPRPGGWMIAESDCGIRKRFMVCEARGHWSASVGGRLWSGEWIRNEREVSKQEAAGDLIAHFPGKVRKILVQVGTHVKKEEVLLLIEAMKMEFSVRAPFSGHVKKILVENQQQITPGDRFIDLEADSDAE